MKELKTIRGFVCRICKQHITDPRNQLYEEYVIIDPGHTRREFNTRIGHICRRCMGEAEIFVRMRSGKEAIRQGTLL